MAPGLRLTSGLGRGPAQRGEVGCASKAIDSMQASTSSIAAGDGGVREVVDAASLVCCMGKMTRKHSDARRWTEMASLESRSTEMV
jgi:hypothetical protein